MQTRARLLVWKGNLGTGHTALHPRQAQNHGFLLKTNRSFYICPFFPVYSIGKQTTEGGGKTPILRVNVLGVYNSTVRRDPSVDFRNHLHGLNGEIILQKNQLSWKMYHFRLKLRGKWVKTFICDIWMFSDPIKAEKWWKSPQKLKYVSFVAQMLWEQEKIIRFSRKWLFPTPFRRKKNYNHPKT